MVIKHGPLKMYKKRQAAQGKEIPSLESFILQQDNKLYNNTNMDEGTTLDKTPLTTIMYSSDIHITNTFKTKDAFFQLLDQRNLVNKERLRPSWDTYFMQLSDLAARRSNCMKRRVGCILVKDSKVVATGYNGTPRGLRNCNEGGCERCNQGAPCGTGLDRCLCMHAEENALLEAGRSRVGFDNGVVLYCNT
jgi:dCMP deaminase